MVQSYYDAVDSGFYREAWELLSPTLQDEQGGYGTWKAGYATTVETKTSNVDATEVSKTSATVALNLKATDVDACGAIVDQTFSGTWTLSISGNDLLGNAFAVERTGGGTPVLDASACGSRPAAPAQGGCDPNYTGCVPIYPPDVDCIDVGDEVEVIGEDVHNLDLGGDQKACEIL